MLEVCFSSFTVDVRIRLTRAGVRMELTCGP
jgi:hypothetical protein